MSIELRFTDEDWERIERDWGAWWEGELDRPMVMMETSPRFPLPGQQSEEFLRDSPIDSMLDHYQEALEDRHFYGDAFPKMWPNYGPGIAAGFLGADVHCTPQTRTVWFDVPEPAEIGDLRFRYDPENFWWRRILDLTRAAVDRWGTQVAVAHTDLGGAVDILASFRGSEGLLYELSDHPEEVTRLLDEITPLWLRYYDELLAVIRETGRGTTPWAAVWSPERCYMFQCDLCYMISPQMFEQFVLPDLSTCFAAMDHAFYHLDGKGQIRHLDMLLALDELAGIQWIPGNGQPQADQWLPLLKRIRDAGKLCQMYVSAGGARRIVRELGGRGFALYVVNQMNPDEARDFLKLLASEDISQ
jgi:hypothetical protein